MRHIVNKIAALKSELSALETQILPQVISSEFRVGFVGRRRFDTLYLRERLVREANPKNPFAFEADTEVIAYALVERSKQPGPRDYFQRIWFLRYGDDGLDGVDFPAKQHPGDRIVDVRSIVVREPSQPIYAARKIANRQALLDRRDDVLRWWDAHRVVTGMPPRPRRSWVARLFGRA